jgi:DNA-binding response OmpR family regulator
MAGDPTARRSTGDTVSAPARVLVAADAPMVVGILGHKLRREGHEVTAVRGAVQVAQAVRSHGFDVAVCEPSLVSDATSLPPWLAIVDGRDDRAGLDAMHMGAAGLVRTPFKPTEVAAQVAALLSIAAVGA